MSDQAAAPGPRSAGATDGRPLALARPSRAPAPARARPEDVHSAEELELLAAIRRATDAHTAAEEALAAARATRQRAIVEALRAGLTKTRIGAYACKAGEPPLSRRQVGRLADEQQPWRDQP